MRNIKVLCLVGLLLLLTGCNQNKGINQLNGLHENSLDYSVSISNTYDGLDATECDFLKGEYTCTNSYGTYTEDHEYADQLERMFFHTFLLPEDFKENDDGNFELTEDGRENFVQRLPWFDILLDEFETLDEALEDALDGFGTVIITIEDNKIETIVLTDDSDTVMITITLDFE